MAESFSDQVSRVELMSGDGQELWDLSDNDVAALKALLADWELLREFERLVREESRPEAIHWLDEQRKAK